MAGSISAQSSIANYSFLSIKVEGDPIEETQCAGSVGSRRRRGGPQITKCELSSVVVWQQACVQLRASDALPKQRGAERLLQAHPHQHGHHQRDGLGLQARQVDQARTRAHPANAPACAAWQEWEGHEAVSSRRAAQSTLSASAACTTRQQVTAFGFASPKPTRAACWRDSPAPNSSAPSTSGASM